MPDLGYCQEFIEEVCAIIDGHDTRTAAHSLEDALMRDADRAWRFDRAGIAMAHADLQRSCDLLKAAVIR